MNVPTTPEGPHTFLVLDKISENCDGGQEYLYVKVFKRGFFGPERFVLETEDEEIRLSRRHLVALKTWMDEHPEEWRR